MKELTAVNWLINKLITENEVTLKGENYKLFELAKEIEKEQKLECWNVAHQAGRFEGKGIAEENWQTFEQYYNETFKSE
jgi:hypothetical protein